MKTITTITRNYYEHGFDPSREPITDLDLNNPEHLDALTSAIFVNRDLSETIITSIANAIVSQIPNANDQGSVTNLAALIQTFFENQRNISDESINNVLGALCDYNGEQYPPIFVTGALSLIKNHELNQEAITKFFDLLMRGKIRESIPKEFEILKTLLDKPIVLSTTIRKILTKATEEGFGNISAPMCFNQSVYKALLERSASSPGCELTLEHIELMLRDKVATHKHLLISANFAQEDRLKIVEKLLIYFDDSITPESLDELFSVHPPSVSNLESLAKNLDFNNNEDIELKLWCLANASRTELSGEKLGRLQGGLNNWFISRGLASLAKDEIPKALLDFLHLRGSYSNQMTFDFQNDPEGGGLVTSIEFRKHWLNHKVESIPLDPEKDFELIQNIVFLATNPAFSVNGPQIITGEIPAKVREATREANGGFIRGIRAAAALSEASQSHRSLN
jgi:hypothetical protein